MTPIQVSYRVVIPSGALSFRAVRSSGPGGQNVNKVASRVELRVDLEAIQGLSESARRRLRGLAASRLDSEGFLLLTSQRTRDQRRNLEDAREKVRRLVERSLVPPRLRVATRPSTASRERRLAQKRQKADRKRQRGALPPEEE
jgi:ribosome-associated protein